MSQLNWDLNKQVFGKKTKSLMEQIGDLFFAFFVAVFIDFVAFSYFYTGIEVEGPSMIPTFNENYYQNHNDSDIVYYRDCSSYNYGDIVIAKADGENIIKRVVGVAGDYIEIKLFTDDKYYLYRNGERITENYILSQDGMRAEYLALTQNFANSLTVGANEVFVMGDNRAVSKDSTYHGCFSTISKNGEKYIVGKVDYVVKYGKLPALDLFRQLFLPFLK